jgi:hypothetical protein
MILSRSTRNRISRFANFLDRIVIRLRRLVRDTTPKRKAHGTEAEMTHDR